MRHGLIIILFLITSLPVSAQKAEFTKNMQVAMQDLIALRFESFEQRIVRERLFNAGNRVPDYLEAASIAIGLFVSGSEADLRRQEPEFEALLTRVEELPDSDPLKGTMRGELYLAKAMLEGKFEHNITAAWHFYRAYHILKDQQQDYPNFMPGKIAYGAIHAMIGSLPDNYRNAASVLGFSGNITAGLRMARQAYEESLKNKRWSHYQSYTGYVYVFLQDQLTDQPVYLTELGFEPGNNLAFVYLHSKMLLYDGQAAAAYQLVHNRPRGAEYLTVPFLQYFEGRLALTAQDPQAEAIIKEFIAKAPSPHYLKSSYRFLAWHYLLNNQPQQAAVMRQKVLQEGAKRNGADKQALFEAERGFNRLLIKARLDFDGGRLNQVLEDLDASALAKHCQKPWEITEFYYRRGRAYQKLKMFAAAKKDFRQALNRNLTQEQYAQGNSALQLAILTEEEGDLAKAQDYYRQALTYEGFPYYEGIHQKAKTALSRLN